MGPRGRFVDVGAGAGAGGEIKLASEGTAKLTLFLAVAGLALKKR